MGERHGDAIHPFVVWITAVAFDVAQGDVVQAGGIQGLPEVLVEHGLTSSRFPALALPAFDPGAQAINQVFAVGAQGESG